MNHWKVVSEAANGNRIWKFLSIRSLEVQREDITYGITVPFIKQGCWWASHQSENEEIESHDDLFCFRFSTETCSSVLRRNRWPPSWALWEAFVKIPDSAFIIANTSPRRHFPAEGSTIYIIFRSYWNGVCRLVLFCFIWQETWSSWDIWDLQTCRHVTWNGCTNRRERNMRPRDTSIVKNSWMSWATGYPVISTEGKAKRGKVPHFLAPLGAQLSALWRSGPCVTASPCNHARLHTCLNSIVDRLLTLQGQITYSVHK
jgi:hypothetical protein